MANTQTAFGFRPIGVGGGAAPNFELRTAKIASANTTKIYKGDPVKMLNTGYIAQWTASTAASQLWGVFVGCKYHDSAEGRVVNRPYWPGANASGDVEAYVVPCILGVAPRFLVASSGTAITRADVGANADVSIGTGSTVTGLSGATLDQSTLATTATLPFRVVDLWSEVSPNAPNGADDSSSYNWVIVAANITGSTGI